MTYEAIIRLAPVAIPALNRLPDADLHLARAQDAHGPGDDEDYDGVGDQRLRGHDTLGPTRERHRVRRADRDRIGQRHVEVDSWAGLCDTSCCPGVRCQQEWCGR